MIGQVYAGHHHYRYTHPLNGPFSGTTQVSQYQKGKTDLDFTEARDSEWQWHQLGHMQVCTSLQTDNHASTPPLSFFTGWTPFLPPNQQHQSTEGKSPLLLQTFKIRTPSALCIALQFKGSDINTSFADWVHDANTFVGYWTPRGQVISQY